LGRTERRTRLLTSRARDARTTPASHDRCLGIIPEDALNARGRIVGVVRSRAEKVRTSGRGSYNVSRHDGFAQLPEGVAKALHFFLQRAYHFLRTREVTLDSKGLQPLGNFDAGVGEDIPG